MDTAAILLNLIFMSFSVYCLVKRNADKTQNQMDARISQEFALVLMLMARGRGAWFTGFDLVQRGASESTSVYEVLRVLELQNIVESRTMSDSVDTLTGNPPLREFRMQGFVPTLAELEENSSKSGVN